MQQADAAFARALDELRQRAGDDVSKWRWGDVHQARSEHRPFSRVKALARWFELRVPIGGDTYTVNVSRVSFRPDAATGELYLNEHAASLRALYDAADPTKIARHAFRRAVGAAVLGPLSRLRRAVGCSAVRAAVAGERRADEDVDAAADVARIYSG